MGRGSSSQGVHRFHTLLVILRLLLGLEGWGEGLFPDPGGCALESGKDVGLHRGQREDRPG